MILDVEQLREDLTEIAAPERASDMARYMKDQFSYLGVASPDRRRTTKSVITAAKSVSADDLLGFATACWGEQEREFQYVAVDALRAGAGHLGAEDLPAVRRLIETKSWWDTVDGLAAWVVGPLVSAHPRLATEMDLWIDDDNMWVARSAILHQLGYKERTDPVRLFGYADKRAEDTEFFIRKALGWALRQYARVDPDAVRSYLDANSDRLSGLTVREASKHL